MDAGRAQCILLIDDDQMLAEGLALGLDREGRTVIVCNNIEAAEMVLERFPVTHVVSDVQFTSAFGFEGLHFASRSRAGARLERRILMTGTLTEALRLAAPAFGADAILEKPFTFAELENALDPTGAPAAGAGGKTIHIGTVDRIISSGGLWAAFQPIVSLEGGGAVPFGFEALGRLREPWPLGHTGDLFDYAERCSMVGELNRASLQAAMSEAGILPEGAAVFVNVDPAALDDRFASSLFEAAGDRGFPLARVVVEITERSSFPDEGAAGRVFERLRERGVRFALDDHGSAYSHLRMIPMIEPSFIKISATFGSEFERDVYKQRIVRNTVNLARDFGARAILEGIETAETAAMALAIGVPLAQGYFFGRPSAASHWAANGRADP